MVTGIAVHHVQIVVHKLAVVFVAVELRVGFDLAQPSDIGEFERGATTKVTTVRDLHARSDDLSHGPVVELVLFI